jgi:hypothetical protein
MTLREFFDFVGAHPIFILAYFLAIPFTALWVGWVSGENGGQTPWKQLYSALIYLVCVPGVLAATLSVYFFLFERGSIMNANVLMQILPIVSMIGTLSIIRKDVDFSLIPGFEKISSLMVMICSVLILMYIMDRTHLFVWVNLPVQYFLGALIGLLLLFRYAMKRFIS